MPFHTLQMLPEYCQWQGLWQLWRSPMRLRGRPHCCLGADTRCSMSINLCLVFLRFTKYFRPKNCCKFGEKHLFYFFLIELVSQLFFHTGYPFVAYAAWHDMSKIAQVCIDV